MDSKVFTCETCGAPTVKEGEFESIGNEFYARYSPTDDGVRIQVWCSAACLSDHLFDVAAAPVREEILEIGRRKVAGAPADGD